MKMKVCIVAGLYKRYIIGGGEIYVQKIVSELSKNNEVVVITTAPDAKLKPSVEVDDGVKVYTFRPIFTRYDVRGINSIIEVFKATEATIVDIFNPYSYKIIKDILKAEKPDIVHTNNVGHISTSVFSAVKSLSLPCVHTCHSYQLISVWPSLYDYRKKKIVDDFNFFDKMYMYIKRLLAESVKVVIAPSKFVLDMHVKHGFFTNAKRFVLPLGIELNNTCKPKKNYETIDILYVGRLVKTKGVHILINAFKQLKHDFIRLHIVGRGPDVKELRKIAGNDERIIFYGFVPDEKLAEMYKTANIVVVPSIWYDNSPLVIYESFKYGTPVIGSRIGGIPELIQEGYNGFLFNPSNSNELKCKLEYLIENVSELKKLEKRAFRSALRYDLSKHIQKLEKIYEEALDCAKEKY